MKTVVTILASVSLVGLLSTIVGINLSNNVSAQPNRPVEVVMLGCSPDFTPTANYTVKNVSSSSNAPAISLGTDCAQALSVLLSSGFEIKMNFPGGGDYIGNLVYTLTTQVDKHSKDK